MNKMLQIIIKPQGRIISDKIKLADTFTSRLIGLMFKDEMIGYDGILLEPCKSVHNFFVKFPIDLVFLNKSNEIVKIIKNFKPWQVTQIYFKANKVLEIKCGLIPETLSEGDILEVNNV